MLKKYCPQLALLACLLAGHLAAEITPPVAPMYYGFYQPIPLYHANGTCAWSGIYPRGNYSGDTAFYHLNGQMAWGGLSQQDLSWTSEKGNFYYDNGQKAWGGLFQERLSFISENGKFFHPNGQKVWGGVYQERTTFCSENGKFYHANGTLAWNGLYGSKVYYANGSVAWQGDGGSSVYDENGNRIGAANFVTLHLGYNNWIYISANGQFELTVRLGEGINMKVKRNTVLLDVYSVIIDVTNDF